MSPGIKDHYQTLGIGRHAQPEDIRKAYLLYASKFHPDKHDGDPFFEERFKEVKEAYDILIDEGARFQYDLHKFKNSRIRRVKHSDFDKPEKNRDPVHRRVDISNLELYISAFYFVNLLAAVVMKGLAAHAAAQGFIKSIFFCLLSTLLIWFFCAGIISRVKKDRNTNAAVLGSSLAIALIIDYVLLGTGWTD